jgi:hypothetical protein
MLRWLFLLALLLAAPASAGPDRVSLMFGSHHIAANQPFEEINPGVFLTWEGRRLDWTVGAFHNSYGRTSVAGTVALPLWKTGELRLDAFAGIAHYPVDGRNFRFHAGDLVPLGGLQLRWRNLFVQAIPLDGGVAAGVLSFGVTFGLN